MLVPAIVTVVILFFVIRFIIGAAKKKQHGEDLGDNRAGSGPRPFPTKGESPAHG